MMATASHGRLVPGLLAAGISLGAAVACAAGETDGVEPDETTTDGGPDVRQTVPDGGRGSTGGSSGGNSGGDAGKDGGDGVDYGPPGPLGPPTGSSCTNPGEELEHTCGRCGIQVAICIDGKVGPYGPCRNEKLAATNCVPGVSSTMTCGHCGSKVRACRNDCTWTETKCKGEATAKDRCMPGDVERRLADCNDGEARTYTCADTCAWSAPSGCTPDP
ncbi:MAG: hypothetical protein BGO98_37945 [Myxococcales bacterium 68-20]|nr:MAG: hypothetical protein BGO98_37945 [Myxococcales bacterium 68-20]